MYKPEVDPTFRRLIEFFHRVGIWVNDEESDFRKFCMQSLHYFFYFLFSVYLAIGAYSAHLSEDRSQLVFLIAIGIAASITWIKMSYLFGRKDEMLKFFYDPIVAHCAENYGEWLIVKQKIRKATAFTKFYIFMLILIVTILPILPIFSRDDRVLPLSIHFNFESGYDMVDMVLYWMTYLCGMIGSVLSAAYSCTLLFIWYILYNYAMEYKLLGHRFRSNDTTAPNAYQQELTRLIRAHNNLFK